MSVEAYEVRLRKDRRGVDLVSDALPFGRLWYGEPNAISNAIVVGPNEGRRLVLPTVGSREQGTWKMLGPPITDYCALTNVTTPEGIELTV